MGPHHVLPTHLTVCSLAFLASFVAFPNPRVVPRSHWKSFATSRWAWLQYLIELAVVAIWTRYVGRSLLGLSHLELNTGGDNISAAGRFFWDHVRSCGSCALWSGEVWGGNPAYIDPNTDTFHPAVAIPALLFGTLDGFKITIVLCMFLGGLACWWLALELGTSSIPRIAAGMIGASGGYLVGRNIQGLVVVLTSIAAAAFVIPAVLRLYRVPNRRSTALLGLVLGLLVLSGQGYLQIGVLFLSPLLALPLLVRIRQWRAYLLRFIEAAVLGILISAIFLFPFLRYYPKFTKELDPGFQSHQTFKYLVLNLVINDWDYFRTDKLLGKHALPGLYINYVGWVVVIFAVIGGAVLWQRSKVTTLLLVWFAIGALWIGSGAPFQLIADLVSTGPLYEFSISIRNPSFIGSAAVPPIIGLAAVGIDAGWKWTVAVPSVVQNRNLRVLAEKGAMIVVRAGTIALLAIGLRNLEHGAHQWLIAESVSPERLAVYLDAMQTDEVAWVSPPNSDWQLQMLGFDAGLKYSDGWRPWKIEGKTDFPTSFRAVRFEPDTAPQDMVLVDHNEVGYSFISTMPNQYAVSTSGGTCTPHGEAGSIDITCDVPEAGVLTVQEYAFDGWTATVNGDDAELIPGQQWLAFTIPAGVSTIELRFRPWDFWVGFALSLVGVVSVILMLVAPDRYRFHFTWKRPSRAHQNPDSDD